jgi:predicted nucleic acid-binding protein
MALYLDTCVLVAALTREPETDAALAFLSMYSTHTLIVSEWVSTEFACAASMKVRAWQLQPSERQRALELFGALRGSLDFIDITRDHFAAAAKLATESATGLRAGDALHLAVTAVLGLTLCSFDRKLVAAATEIGIETLVP